MPNVNLIFIHHYNYSSRVCRGGQDPLFFSPASTLLDFICQNHAICRNRAELNFDAATGNYLIGLITRCYLICAIQGLSGSRKLINFNRKLIFFFLSAEVAFGQNSGGPRSNHEQQ